MTWFNTEEEERAADDAEREFRQLYAEHATEIAALQIKIDAATRELKRYADKHGLVVALDGLPYIGAAYKDKFGGRLLCDVIEEVVGVPKDDLYAVRDSYSWMSSSEDC